MVTISHVSEDYEVKATDRTSCGLFLGIATHGEPNSQVDKSEAKRS